MRDFSILIPVALPSSGPALLRIAEHLAPADRLRVTALHCRTDDENASVTKASAQGAGPLEPLLRAADRSDIEPVHQVSDDVEEDILTAARERSAALILMGWHRPMVPDGEPAGPIRGVFERAECDVAVFLARDFRQIRRVLAPFHGGKHDRRALEIAARIARSSGVDVTVLHVVTPERSRSEKGLSATVDEFSDGRVRLVVVESDDPVGAAVREAWTGYDLIVAGASEVWGTDFSIFPERLQKLAFATPSSLLVVRAPGVKERGDSPPTASDADENSLAHLERSDA